jgi:flagellar protein FliO/FliZ
VRRRLALLLPSLGLPALLGVAAAAGLALALAPGDLAPASLRAAAVACALGAAALLARRARSPSAHARRLALLSRQPLSRDAGVALVELDGRPLLVGFGPGGVQLLQAGAAAEPGQASGTREPRP